MSPPLDRRLLRHIPQSGNTPRTVEPLPLKVSVDGQSLGERLVDDALRDISRLYGIRPPKVLVFTDVEEYLEAKSELFAAHRAAVERLAESMPDELRKRGIKPGGDMFLIAKKRYIAGQVALEFFRAASCFKVTSPDSKVDSVIRVDPKKEDFVFRGGAVEEAAHCVLFRVGDLIGMIHPTVIQETLSSIHGILYFRGPDRDSTSANLNEARLVRNPPGQPFRSQPYYDASTSALHAYQLFDNDFDLEDAAVVLATSKGVCGEEDDDAGDKIMGFLDALAGRERSNPGSLRGLADERRAMLREKEGEGFMTA